MKNIPFSIIFTLIFALFGTAIHAQTENKPLKTFHDFTVKTIDGQDFNLATLKGKRILVVNTATQCGLTPQFAVLQRLYETLDTSKFAIIGFPANNFLEQDPGTNEEIKDFCSKNYGVTFPMMGKVSVCDYIYKSYPPAPEKSSPTTTDEIYKWLTQKSLNGVLDTKIKWNFQKFFIDENGNLIGTLAPNVGEEINTILQWIK